MLRIGSVILSLFCVLNMLPALAIVVYVALLANIHPLLPMRFSEADIAAISPRLLDTINGMAIFANGHVFAFSLIALVAIWKGLNQRVIWVFRILLITMMASILAGFAATYIDGSQIYGPSIIGAFLLIIGFSLSAISLFGAKRH